MVQREQYALGRCVRVESGRSFFRARGNEAYRRVQRSASTAPNPKGSPSAKLGPPSPPLPPRSRTRTLRGGPHFVLGRGLTGIPVRLCSAAGHTDSQFP